MKKLYILLLILLALPLVALGQLSLPQGGTGLTSYTDGDIVWYDSSDSLHFQKLGIGSGGECLTVNAGSPDWASCLSGLTFGTDNQIPFINTGGNNFEYSSNLVFNGTTLSTLNINPITTASYDLGSTSKQWSDLFLGSGSVINWNNGDVNLTHSSNALRVAGGSLNVDSLGYNSLRSVFGERQIFVSEFTDALWRANWRYTVTQSGTGTLASLFDAGFETTYVVPVSTTDVVNINMANQSGVPAAGVTYPEGKIYIHFYYTNHQYSAISMRVKQNGVWYALSAPTDISTDASDKVLEFTVPANNYMTDIELTVTTDGTNPVWITGMNYIPTRWTSELESPYVDKYLSDNTFIGNNVYFKNTANSITARINANDNWYMGVGGSGGKFGIGTSTPGTYHLNVVGNILGNDIVTNSGSVFKSLGTAYLRATGTSAIHIGDSAAQPIDLGAGGGAVAINTDYSNIPSGTKLQVNAGSATSSSTILKLYGSSTGFSGANDAGTAYALTIDGTAYQTSIVQVPGAKIEMAKENTWNYADTPTGTLGSLKFYTSAGTPNSPTLTEKMRITSSGNVGIGGATTPLSKLDVRYDANINTTTPGTTAYGTLHLVPTTGTDGNSTGISFGTNNSGSVSATSQAGIYVQGSSGYGTRMHFATSNNFGTGATTRLSISEGGNVTMTGSLGITGTRVSKGWFTDIESTNMPTVGGTSLSSTFQGLDTQLTSLAGLSYTGNSLKVVRVNAGETGFELATLAGGGDALKADPLSQFASTTSLQLAGVISDETGSGALVFGTSPTLTTPNLGTPSAVTLTNATGLPLTGLVSDTATALGLGSINIGHATDTTITRTSAGVIAVEGLEVTLNTATQTLTNKTIDEAIISGTPDTNGELGRDTTQSALNYYDNGQLGTIPKVITSGVGTQSLINSTASDQDFTSLVTLPANAITTNKMYRVTATYEMVTGVSTVTLINYLKVCGTKVFTQTAQNFVNSTTVSFVMQYFITGRASPSASSAVTTAAAIGMGANFNGGNITNQPVNLATNGTCAITPGVTYSGTGSTESLELQAWTIEEIN